MNHQLKQKMEQFSNAKKTDENSQFTDYPHNSMAIILSAKHKAKFVRMRHSVKKKEIEFHKFHKFHKSVKSKCRMISQAISFKVKLPRNDLKRAIHNCFLRQIYLL